MLGGGRIKNLVEKVQVLPILEEILIGNNCIIGEGFIIGNNFSQISGEWSQITEMGMRNAESFSLQHIDPFRRNVADMTDRENGDIIA